MENLQSQCIIELGIPIRWRKLGFEKIDYYDFGTVQFEHRCIYTLFSPIENAVRMYRMTLLCNAGLFMPALSLIRKEKNNK